MSTAVQTVGLFMTYWFSSDIATGIKKRCDIRKEALPLTVDSWDRVCWMLSLIENKCKIFCVFFIPALDLPNKSPTAANFSFSSFQMVLTGFYVSPFSATKLPPRSNRSNTVSRDLCFSECARIAWQLTNGRPFQINKFLAWRSWPAWWRSWRQTSGDTNQSNSCWDSHHHELRFICQRNGEDCFIICMNTVLNLYKYFLGLFKSIKYDIFKAFIIECSLLHEDIIWDIILKSYFEDRFWRLVLFFSLLWTSSKNSLAFNWKCSCF